VTRAVHDMVRSLDNRKVADSMIDIAILPNRYEPYTGAKASYGHFGTKEDTWYWAILDLAKAVLAL